MKVVVYLRWKIRRFKDSDIVSGVANTVCQRRRNQLSGRDSMRNTFPLMLDVRYKARVFGIDDLRGVQEWWWDLYR